MSKPDWNEAPEWANFLAQDSNGAWSWFEQEPLVGDSGGWRCLYGDCEEAASNPKWQSTLEQRQ